MPPLSITQRFRGFGMHGIGSRLEYRGVGQCKWEQWATSDHGGDPRNTSKRELRRGIHFFRGFRTLGHLIFSLRPPFAQCPTFRRFRNASYWMGLECRRERDGHWGDRHIVPHQRKNCKRLRKCNRPPAQFRPFLVRRWAHQFSRQPSRTLSLVSKLASLVRRVENGLRGTGDPAIGNGG